MNPVQSQSNSEVGRRDFLKAAAVAAVAGPLVAPKVHASDKSGARRAVIGSGEHQYECLHDWGMESLPNGAHYGGASHGVAIDSAGMIYITHGGDPGSLFVFDSDARFVKSMGAEHQISASAGRKEARGHGIDIRSEGDEEFIYLSPNDPGLSFTKMTLGGEVVWSKSRADIQEATGRYPDQTPLTPTNTSFSPDGGFFLGDGYGSSMIHQFGADGEYLRTIGGEGEGDGQFRTPHGHWLDDRDGQPLLVVADRANERLQWFDMDGNYVKQLGGFLYPADIDVQGDLMLVPDLHCRVTLLDKENNVLTQLGDDPDWRKKALEGFKMRGQRDQWLPGKFVHPHDACFDADGNIFVTEWVVTGRVTKLQKVG